MFPYAPADLPEVVTFMRGIGAPTRTAVPRTGSVLPEYATRPWAQPPAAVHFYAPDFFTAGSFIKFAPRHQVTWGQYTTAHTQWVEQLYMRLGAIVGCQEERGALGEKPLAGFVFLAHLAMYLESLGLSRTHTANVLMLLWDHNASSRVIPQRHYAWREAPGEILAQVIELMRLPGVTALQVRTCLDSNIPLATLQEFVAQGVPLNLIQDLYPTSPLPTRLWRNA